MKKVVIEVEVKDFCSEMESIQVDDYIKYNGDVYQFIGYEWGTYPIARNVLTNETVTLPHY
jgi:hypothetical protein